MLIRANDLLDMLAKRKLELMSSVFETPPETYDKFAKVVGRVQELSETEKVVRELARRQED